jgi:hypothetical protein
LLGGEQICRVVVTATGEMALDETADHARGHQADGFAHQRNQYVR